MQYTEQIGYKSEARIKARLESIEYYPFHIHENSLEIICVLNGTVEICDSAATYPTATSTCLIPASLTG